MCALLARVSYLIYIIIDNQRQHDRVFQFCQVNDFPKVQGAEDCTRKDVCFLFTTAIIYVNWEGYCSLNIQLI